MKTIKIIDLLVKNANNEEKPKKFKCDGYVWEYIENMRDWYSYKNKCYIFHEYFKETLISCLNYEVEIIDKYMKED